MPPGEPVRAPQLMSISEGLLKSQALLGKDAGTQSPTARPTYLAYPNARKCSFMSAAAYAPEP
jgi:hypothetical protein